MIERFAPLRTHLLNLLAGLGESDWGRPTAAPRWSVKDIAAHLLGGDIGILSRGRDTFHLTSPVGGTYQELVNLVDRLNEEWVMAARRMSPRLIRELLALTGPEVETYFSSQDMKAMNGPVSWAGPDPAPVWFDIAREFTERWHHQQQIRDATSRPALYDPYFLAPVLDTFVRALPHRFRETTAPDGTIVTLEISGEAGGIWHLIRAGYKWDLVFDSEVESATVVVLPQDTAWRMFTKGIDPERARKSALVRGNAALAESIFTTVSVIG